MGPMGPMGSMMGQTGGPWGYGATDWSLGLVVLLLLLVLGLIALAAWRGNPGGRSQPRSSAEVLRERYARGDLTRQAYREALADVLKDRYVRGEIDLDDYEARVERLLREPPSNGALPRRRDRWAELEDAGLSTRPGQ